MKSQISQKISFDSMIISCSQATQDPTLCRHANKFYRIFCNHLNLIELAAFGHTGRFAAMAAKSGELPTLHALLQDSSVEHSIRGARNNAEKHLRTVRWPVLYNNRSESLTPSRQPPNPRFPHYIAKTLFSKRTL